MEAKLREMRALAVYAANRSLSETEVAQVQEWMDILQAEVVAMDKETAWVGADGLAHWHSSGRHGMAQHENIKTVNPLDEGLAVLVY